MTKIDSEQPRLADKERGFRVFTTLRDVNGERIGKGGCLIPDKLRRGDFLIDGQSKIGRAHV